MKLQWLYLFDQPVFVRQIKIQLHPLPHWLINVESDVVGEIFPQLVTRQRDLRLIVGKNFLNSLKPLITGGGEINSRNSDKSLLRTAHTANTKPRPVTHARDSPYRRRVDPSLAKVIAGSPMIKAASLSFSMRSMLGAEVTHFGSTPRNSRKMIFNSAADVRDDSSSATERTSLRSLTLVTRTTLRTFPLIQRIRPVPVRCPVCADIR